MGHYPPDDSGIAKRTPPVNSGVAADAVGQEKLPSEEPPENPAQTPAGVEQPATPPPPRRPTSLPTSLLAHLNDQPILLLQSTSQQNYTIADDASDDASDDGYGSDVHSWASTSVESYVQDYLYENGRRYHRFREGSYHFPNDDREQKREDVTHAMVTLICGKKLHLAPIGNSPQEILDIGTGTGIWAIKMADQYPSADVMGIDLSPIQPVWLPQNVRFLVDDVESPWLDPPNYFDYIHARHMVMAIKDWENLLLQSLKHLKPGGWMELQEIHYSPVSARSGELVNPEHRVAQFWNHVIEGLGKLGVDLNTASDGRLKAMMQDAGFVNVTEKVFHVPIGTWPKDKGLKEVGLDWRKILLDGIQAIALGPLTRGLDWSREAVEMFLINVREGYKDDQALMYMEYRVVYGQKPTHMV